MAHLQFLIWSPSMTKIKRISHEIDTLGLLDHQILTPHDKWTRNLFTGCSIDCSGILLHMKNAQHRLCAIHHHAIYEGLSVE
ncbi:hypothetical protein Peur_068736 [Populus x canadensis]